MPIKNAFRMPIKNVQISILIVPFNASIKCFNQFVDLTFSSVRSPSFFLRRQGGEIRVTAFNDQVDRFFPMVEVGTVLMLSKAGLQHKKPVRVTG